MGIQIQSTDGKWYELTLNPAADPTPVVDPPVVIPPPVAVAPVIPANAIVASALENSPLWGGTHDAATPGTAAGSTSLVTGMGRNFNFTYTQKAGMRFSVKFGQDTLATHFVYALDVYFDDPSQIQNLELDMNQVLADGKTCILGAQAASGSGSWEYTLMNAPTHWHPSNLKTDPRQWPAKTWRRIRIFTHQAAGVVTYDGIEIDGVYEAFDNAVGASAVAIGWKMGTLLINFQIEGSGAAGTVNVYARNMSVTRW